MASTRYVMQGETLTYSHGSDAMALAVSQGTFKVTVKGLFAQNVEVEPVMPYATGYMVMVRDGVQLHYSLKGRTVTQLR